MRYNWVYAQGDKTLATNDHVYDSPYYVADTKDKRYNIKGIWCGGVGPASLNCMIPETHPFYNIAMISSISQTILKSQGGVGVSKRGTRFRKFDLAISKMMLVYLRQ